MEVDITNAYTRQYADPISFEAGAVVEIEREDPEYPGWLWCRVPSGKEGWVHRSFLADSVGATRSVDAYSATELTVIGGEHGTAIQRLDGWVYVRLDNGEQGWIPESHIQGRSC